jgi:hypothetical protein
MAEQNADEVALEAEVDTFQLTPFIIVIRAHSQYILDTSGSCQMYNRTALSTSRVLYTCINPELVAGH